MSNTAFDTLVRIEKECAAPVKKPTVSVHHPFVLMGEHQHGDTFTSIRLPFEEAMMRFADIAIYMSERGGRVELVRMEPGKPLAVVSRYAK